MNSYNSLAKQLRESGMNIITELDNKNIINLIMEANKTYCEGNPFLTDAEYDTIVATAYERKGMKTKLDKIIGAPVANERKTTLPYFMGSMNKIKPDTNAVSDWKVKFAEPYVFSAKLDGVSGLYMVKNNVPKLYTRGNGTVGQDISFLLPQFSLPIIDGIVIRGEFLISKDAFNLKWKHQFSNARNLVSGLINAKRHTSDRYADLEFVAYEIIEPSLMPSMGFHFLKEQGFKTVKNGQILMANNLTNDLLSKTLVQWRKSLPYEIDGVIVTSDRIYERKNENPKHSFAFKMVLSDQIVEAHVVDVIWAASKDGYLKPRVKITPVTIGGATIEYATGFNAAFIKEHKIGIGSIISLIRSGDVIPHIQGIIQKAQEPLFPNVPYLWNNTKVDIYVDTSKTQENNTYTQQIIIKNLMFFFRGIGVEFLSTGNITNLVNHGYNTVGKIITMNPQDFVHIDGMGQIIGEKITKSIKNSFQNAKLIDIMIHSNIFGRSIGPKKITQIMMEYPDILSNPEDLTVKVENIITLNGFAKKTATEFVYKISQFINWLHKENLEEFLDKAPIHESDVPTKKNKSIANKTFVFTGFRNKELEDYIISNGGKVTATITKQTYMLVFKPGAKGGKLEKASKLNVHMINLRDFQEIIHK